MSRPFHSRITRQNQSKNERATPKDPKIPFLGLDAKGHKTGKIRNRHPTSFCNIFQGKKVYSKRTTRSMCLVGVVKGRHINVSVPVYTQNIFWQKSLNTK